jgi:hypothetical protein
VLNIQGKTCTFGKIANNTETLGKDGDWRTGFTIPFKDLILERNELAAFCDDEYLERILFDDKGNGSQVPTLAGYEPLVMTNDFDNASVTIALPSRKSELEFDDCKVKDVTLESVLGGTVKVSGKLYLHPGLKRENLTLQEYQHCTEVKLSIADAQIATKSRDKQQDMFQPEGEEKGEGFAAAAKASLENGAAGDSKEERNEAAARAQVEAFNRGSENPETPPPPNDNAEFAGKAAEKVAEFRDRARRGPTKDAH